MKSSPFKDKPVALILLIFGILFFVAGLVLIFTAGDEMEIITTLTAVMIPAMILILISLLPVIIKNNSGNNDPEGRAGH